MFVRKLNRDEWNAYKVIRLEALSRHEGVYGNSLAYESAWADSQWADMFSSENTAFFGLYDGDKLVGNTVVFTDRTDESGRTALLAGSYIRENYRGRGLSRLLYEARIEWIKSSGLFDRIVVGHRQGNEASRRANQAFGFQKTGEIEKTWGDGSRGIIHTYEMRIK